MEFPSKNPAEEITGHRLQYLGRGKGVQMKISLFAALIVVGGSSIARACLNDRDVLIAEREFRSEYLDHKSPPEASANSNLPLGWMASATGAALALACPIVLRKKS